MSKSMMHLLGIVAAPLMFASAVYATDCQISLTGQFIITQLDHNTPLTFQLIEKNDSKVTGPVTFPGHTGEADGTVSKDRRGVDLIVKWDAGKGATGRYTWDIGPNGQMVHGKTIDVNNINSQSELSSTANFCLK